MAAGSIKFACPHCHRRCKVPLDLGGKRGRCPGCKRALEVPLPGGDEAEDPAAGTGEPSAPRLHWTTKVGLACVLCLPLPGLIFSFVGLQQARRAQAPLHTPYLAVSLNAAWLVFNMLYMAVKM